MTISPILPPSKIIEALISARRPLLIAHIAPDGDAIGSLLGLGLALHKIGKEPILACQDRVPMTMRFLPYQDRIVRKVHDSDIDLVVSLDSSDPDRMGEIYDHARFHDLQLVVIDHHVTNVRFGTLNWIEDSCCATVEMIYYLLQSLNIPLDPDIATCILTGLVTDTRGFRTANTTSRVMSIASSLMDAGAPLSKITENVLNSRTYDTILLWGRVLATVQRDGNIISAENRIEHRQDLNGVIRAEGLVSFILGAYGVDVAVVFTELPEHNKVECSLRARPGHDVATVALELGGGGHPLASGCTVEGSIEEVRSLVFELLRKPDA